MHLLAIGALGALFVALLGPAYVLLSERSDRKRAERQRRLNAAYYANGGRS